MRHKLKAARMIWQAGAFLLLMVFAFSALGASAPAQIDPERIGSQIIAQYQTSQANPALHPANSTFDGVGRIKGRY